MIVEPLISVVINNYNYGRFVADAIESALAQTYRRTQILVVDDGSTDNSREVIARYADRVTPVLKENGGQGSAFNAGFAASRGEIVVFLDADDMLGSATLETVAPLFDQPGTSRVQWRLDVIDASGRPTGANFPRATMPEGDFLERCLANGPFYDAELMPPTSGNAWSREFLQEVLPLPAEQFDHGADVYLHTLAPIFGTSRCIQASCGFYRSHGKNHYWKSPLVNSRLEEYLRRFESSSLALERYLRAQGYAADSRQWKQTNFNYLWPSRLIEARREIARLVPEGASYILINGDEWGSGEPVAGRRAIPYLEQDGTYAGPPANEAHAIDELERLHTAGACAVVLWWTQSWWLHEYPELFRQLSEKSPSEFKTDAVQIFNLSHTAGRKLSSSPT